MRTPVRQLLCEKPLGGAIRTTRPTTSILVAVGEMNEHKVGSLLVIDGSEVVGILTERDILVRVIESSRDPSQTTVGQVMTRELITIGPSTTVAEAMKLITERRCRHLPVVDRGRVCGMISIGDLMSWLARESECRIRELEDYITH